MSLTREQRIVMTKKVAKRWLDARSSPKYYLRVWYRGPKSHRLVDALKSFRDGKIVLANLDPIKDLGVKGSFDSVAIWSEDRESLITLREWFEKTGYETTGIW